MVQATEISRSAKNLLKKTRKKGYFFAHEVKTKIQTQSRLQTTQQSGLISLKYLKRTYDRNDSKRPAIPGPKQIFCAFEY